MGFYRKKRKHWLLSAAFAILFLVCFFQEMNAYARQREQYTSVTVEYRDADTGEAFHIYVHPWQRVGKKYTYYAKEQICQEGKGCYWYDENHAGPSRRLHPCHRKRRKTGSSCIINCMTWGKKSMRSM